MKWLCWLWHKWTLDLKETTENAVTESGVYYRVTWWRECRRCGVRRVDSRSRWYRDYLV